MRNEGSQQCLQVNGAATRDRPNGFGSNGPRYNSVFFSCAGGNFEGAGGVTAAEVEALITAGSNNVLSGTSTLTSGFINGANENAATATAFPTSGNEIPASVLSFVTPVDYIGAVRDANDNWYQGWTCGLPNTPGC